MTGEWHPGVCHFCALCPRADKVDGTLDPTPEEAAIARTPEQIDALLDHIDRRGHFMNPHSIEHQHALADDRLRALMRSFLEGRLDHNQVADRLDALDDADPKSARAVRTWARSLRNTDRG